MSGGVLSCHHIILSFKRQYREYTDEKKKLLQCLAHIGIEPPMRSFHIAYINMLVSE